MINEYHLEEVSLEAFLLAQDYTTEFLKMARRVGCPPTRKQLSELISGIIETSFEEVASYHNVDVVAPKNDGSADLIWNGIPLEIKTKYGKTGDWRGGAYSKRSSDYLFVCWEYGTNENEVRFFCIHKYVDEDEWKEGNVKNYYATRLSLEDIVDGNLILGRVEKARTRLHAIPQSIVFADMVGLSVENSVYIPEYCV